MGKEIGQECKTSCRSFVVLAFFSVVASSPNLSTMFTSAKVRQFAESTKFRAEETKQNLSF